MDYSLAQIILVASSSDGEDVFWVHMLVLVVLASLVGIGSLIKTRANKFKDQEQDYPEYAGATHTRAHRQNKALKELKDKCLGIFLKTAQSKDIIEEPTLDFEASGIAGQEKPRNESSKERKKDLASGMEMLEPDFLVRIVETTKCDDKNDVMMQKLSFNELLRRGKQDKIDSSALTVYAINEGNLYGKDIQCEAMNELTKRTGLSRNDVVVSRIKSPGRRRLNGAAQISGG